MHGEYKIPGGKLVIADLDVRDGQLRDVKISGDFFLEPDTALERIDAAVEGLRADAPEAEIARQVLDAVSGAELIGISPDGVATAVRRAVEGAAQ